VAGSELLALGQHKLVHPSAASHNFAGILGQEELTSRQEFLCACSECRASLALRGNTRSVLGMRMAPAQLCSQEMFRVRGHPELERRDLLAEHQSHQTAFRLGRWAEAGAQDGLPRRHSACRGC